jgi:hypothetical protein
MEPIRAPQPRSRTACLAERRQGTITLSFGHRHHRSAFVFCTRNDDPFELEVEGRHALDAFKSTSVSPAMTVRWLSIRSNMSFGPQNQAPTA